MSDELNVKSLPPINPANQGVDHVLSKLTGVAVSAGDPIPAYWSPFRDRYLRNILTRNDYGSSALYNAVVKLGGIEFKVMPKNRSVMAHSDLADITQEIWSISWEENKERFLQDVLGQDNGGFLEILDAPTDLKTPPNKPRLTFGGVRYIDAATCQRTNDPLYPVLVRHTDNNLYKLHHTRVLDVVQMPSGNRKHNGIGFCAISRALYNIAQLTDLTILFQEFLGARPISQVIFGAGMDAQQLKDVFDLAETKLDSEGLTRFSKMVYVGSDNPDAKLTTLPLKYLPQNYNKKEEISLAMYLIALAFGFDARELWVASASGATKADAEVQADKSRGKTPAWFEAKIKKIVQAKILPPQLELISEGLVDDRLDEARSKIYNLNSQSYKAYLDSAIMDIRAIRVAMLENGDLPPQEFERLELTDGRLPDGNDIITLFYTSDPYVLSLLDLGIPDPLDIESNDPENMIRVIDAQLRIVLGISVTASRSNQRIGASQAHAALSRLRDIYTDILEPETPALDEAPTDNDPTIASDTIEDSNGDGSGKAKTALPGDPLYTDPDNDFLISTGDVEQVLKEATELDPILGAMLKAEIVKE